MITRPRVHRYVATKTSASEAATACIVLLLTSTAFWVVSIAIYAAAFVSGLMIVFPANRTDAFAKTLGLAMLELLLCDGFTIVLSYWRTRRRFARRMAPGAVWKSEFLPDRLLVFGPRFEDALRYSRIRSVRTVRDWAVIGVVGTRRVAVLPGPLVPPDEADHLRRRIADRL